MRFFYTFKKDTFIIKYFVKYKILLRVSGSLILIPMAVKQEWSFKKSEALPSTSNLISLIEIHSFRTRKYKVPAYDRLKNKREPEKLKD